MTVRRGAFITLEGGEGVGKSTSLETVKRFIAQRGFDVVVTREPGGTALGERIREWILHGEHDGLLPEVEVLLMFAARAEHLAEVIRPSLDVGTWVVSDRFTDATFAYQGGGRGCDLEFLERLEKDVQAGLEPDLTLLLDAPVAVSLERIAGRGHDHFERESVGFFERVRQTYLERAERDPGRIKIVDATPSLEAVQAAIVAELEAFASRFPAGGRHEAR